MKELSIEEKAKTYDEALKKIKECTPDENGFVTIYPNEIFPELKEYEQNILFEELKALHLKMEYQTVCNDAKSNRMWRRVRQHVNEAINIIKEDKEIFRW